MFVFIASIHRNEVRCFSISIEFAAERAFPTHTGLKNPCNSVDQENSAFRRFEIVAVSCVSFRRNSQRDGYNTRTVYIPVRANYGNAVARIKEQGRVIGGKCISEGEEQL